MKNKNIISTLLVIIIAILSISFGYKIINKKDSQINIKVADIKAVGGALFHVAIEKGYFKDEGLNVEVVGVQTGDEALRAVLSNNVDIGLVGIIPYSFFALDDQSVKIFAMNAYVNDNQIIANRSKGIEKAEDLRGKKIGYAKTTASDIGISQFLNNNNLSIDGVELINIKPLAMPGALQSGQIDAYSMWEPHILNGQKLLKEEALVFSNPKDIYTWHQCLMSKDSYIKNNHKILVKFLKAMVKAEKFVASNKNEAMVLTSPHNKLSVDVLEKIWSKYDLRITLGDDIYKILEIDLNWANSQREKKLDVIPNPKNLVEISILNDVKN
jgi:NitT/TauT family transport system substrate-binding protein